MYFCPNCNNVFDITREEGKTIASETSEDSKKGGAKIDYNELINKLIENEEIEETIENLDIDDILKSDAYKKLKSKQKEYVYNRLQDILPLNKKKITYEDVQGESAYFICKNCGSMKKIDPGTLIYSSVSGDITQSYSVEDNSTMKYSDILPFTRKYKCPNKDCPSYQDASKKEASFFRMNNTYKVKYICHACNTII